MDVDEDVDPWVESEGEGEETHDSWAYSRIRIRHWAGWIVQGGLGLLRSIVWSSVALGFWSRGEELVFS